MAFANRWLGREALLGRRIELVATLTWAGRTIYLSTDGEEISNGSETIATFPGLVEATFSEQTALFSLGDEPATAEIKAYLPPDVDVAGLVALGHSLGAGRAELAVWASGLDWSQRRILAIGRLREPDYGAADQGLAFTLEAEIFSDPTTIPEAGATVDDGTWTVSGRLSPADVGLAYPRVYGYPGKTSQSTSGWITGSAAVWVDKRRFAHKLCVAGHPVEATQVYINHDGDTGGELVNVTTTTDKRGRTITIIDYDAEDYDYTAGGVGAFFLGADYCPAAEEDVEIFVGWFDGGGGTGADGRVIRSAGDVIEDVLGFTGVAVDRHAWGCVKPLLAGFQLDCVIDAAVRPWDWIVANVFPLVPLSVVSGPMGLYPVFYRFDATAADAVAHLDADLDESIEVAPTIEVDTGDIQNSFSLDYGYSVRTEEYSFTARLDAEYVENTATARAKISNTATGSLARSITVYAQESGPGGAGILLELTTGGADAVAEVVATKTVTITAGPAATMESLTTEIRGYGGTLITCDESDDTTSFAAGFSTGSESLTIEDASTMASPYCQESQRRYRDVTEDRSGVFPWSGESAVVYDAATAHAALGWRAAAFSLERRRLHLVVPIERGAWLALGDVVTITRADLSLDRQVGLIEGMEWYGDEGAVALRVLFVENLARDVHPGAA